MTRTARRSRTTSCQMAWGRTNAARRTTRPAHRGRVEIIDALAALTLRRESAWRRLPRRFPKTRPAWVTAAANISYRQAWRALSIAATASFQAILPPRQTTTATEGRSEEHGSKFLT